MPYDSASPLYAAVLRVLKDPADSGTTDEIGLRAWQSLSWDQRRGDLPFALGAYVGRVIDDENSRRLDEAAADRTHSYLDDHDWASVWDSAMGDPDYHGDVEVNRQSLINVVYELELLQHRLAMRDQEAA